MASLDSMFEVSVRDPNGHHQVIPVRPGMNVRNIKEIFAQNTGLHCDQFRLVFAGHSLNDHDTLETLGVHSHSTLHCIRGRVTVQTQSLPSRNVRPVEERLAEMDASGSHEGQEHHRFFVYCKSPCRSMKPGKLRVRCADCKDEAFVLTTDPQDWNDVLEKRKLHGNCHKEGCRGNDAEFFFKCADHVSPPGTQEQCVALHMLRANTVSIECPMCTDVKETVVVFDCADTHCMCLDCFLEYAGLALRERRFIERQDCGYTIKCPSGCDDSYVTEIHHFQLLGPDMYERYQRFGTEECLLQMGGVLCPRERCGMGMLPENPGRQVTCPECRFTFCRECKSEYHVGPCTNFPLPATNVTRGQQIDGERLRHARFNVASETFIRENYAIKRCPNCNVNIEKNGGCMHMTCRSCRHEFCWLCLIPWNNTCQGRHWFGERN